MTDDRRMTTDRFFGGVDDRLSNLHNMLSYIEENEPDSEELRRWLADTLGVSSQSTMDSYLGFQNSIQIISRQESMYNLATEGRSYLDSQDDKIIFDQLTKHVKGFEEILLLLQSDQKTVSTIAAELKEEFPGYKLPDGVVKRHLEWLQCIGYIERNGHMYSITERGDHAISTVVEHGDPTIDIDSPGSEKPQGPSENDLRNLRQQAKKSGSDKTEATVTTKSTTEYNRSQAVKRYVKARANGVCEGCEEPAPFTSRTGEPYLHAHHVRELSGGGSDTPATVVALCPNCHYRVHHGEDGEEFNNKLRETVRQLESDS